MAPELAPFMADECLLSMPEVEGIDYTMKEYIKLVEKTKECVERLNAQGGDWTPHKVEMTVWSFFVLRENKPHVLDDLPPVETEAKRVARENGLHQEVSNGQLETPEDTRPPSPGSIQSEAPVENGNGHSVTPHTEEAEEDTEAALPSSQQPKRSLEETAEPEAAAPESKRPCVESETNQPPPAPAAPNGVNSTPPQPIATGGD